MIEDEFSTRSVSVNANQFR